MHTFKVTFFDDRRPQVKPPAEFEVQANSQKEAIENATSVFKQKFPDEDIYNYESHCPSS